MVSRDGPEVLSHAEPVFTRFKSLAQVGGLPKYNGESAKAWVCAKLFAALPVEKVLRHASAIPPWGHELGPGTSTQRLA